MSKLIIESQYLFDLLLKAKEIQSKSEFKTDRDYIKAKTTEDILLDILHESTKYNK